MIDMSASKSYRVENGVDATEVCHVPKHKASLHHDPNSNSKDLT